MKKGLSLLLTVILSLSLSACGQASIPQQDQSDNAAAFNQDDTGSQVPADEDYEFVEPTTVMEQTIEEGSYTLYLDANEKPIRSIFKATDGTIGESTYYPNGTMASSSTTTPDGVYTEYYYDENGNCTSYNETQPDGTYAEYRHYPSGNMQSAILSSPNGEYRESRYLDDGVQEGDTRYSGTQVYLKTIAADGTLDEHVWDENGNRISEIYKGADGEFEYTLKENGEAYERNLSFVDGSFWERHYKNDVLIKNHQADKEREWIEEYDEQGVMIFSSEKFTNGYYIEKHYESGKVTKQIDSQYNESGIPTFFRCDCEECRVDCTFDDAGTLIQCIRDGTAINDPAQLAEIAAELGF